MTNVLEIQTLDYHTAGEPLRIVTGGLPDIPGADMLARRRYMRDRLDHVRTFLMHEPRGHADMYGVVLTGPATPGADCGVLFLHNEGYSTMCGHGIIALATAAVEHGLVRPAERGVLRIDTPAGRVTARAVLEAGAVTAVTFENVPAFVADVAAVSIDGRVVPYTLAFGGAFYAYVDAAAAGLAVEPGQAAQLIEFGRAVKHAIGAAPAIAHPDGRPDLDFLYGVIFIAEASVRGAARNACVFADGELDRSPTGTGVSGLAAIRYFNGDLALQQALEVESIIGTRFRVCCTREVVTGRRPAVVTEVTGSAYQTGTHTFILRDNDPLPEGFFIR